MATQYLDTRPVAAVSPPKQESRRYLFGPWIDFLCLGGSSLLLLPLILLLPIEAHRTHFVVGTMFLAHFINHPHFAHSYQIFYGGYRAKAFSASLGRGMQARYLIAGVVAPLLLVAFFAFCILRGDARLLGYGANAMGFFVGWHYVKQGYGMLMVDAALKRQFFDAAEKKVFLINSYAVWVFAWMSVNRAVSQLSMWEVHYYSFAVPGLLVALAGAVAAATTGWTLWTFAARYRSTGALPVNGVVAYTVSLYLWLLFVRINPLWALVVPALHSLQYLVVVWRFRTNYERAQLATPGYKAGSITRQIFGSNPWGHLGLFVVSGAIMGFVGFWGLPAALDINVPHDKALFGGSLFLFVLWIFINVHHYFLDNVMWRRENPDTRRYLFG